MPDVNRPQWVDDLDGAWTPRWVRCALQVNPYGYSARHGLASTFSSEQEYNAAVVDALIDAKVELIAVTDHYRVDESLGLLEAARTAGLIGLPGFEASTAEGLHFLVIHEEESSASELERCIGRCKVQDLGSPSPQGRISALELLEVCDEFGAACIAAHVTHDNGLLKHVLGQARLAIWKADALRAVAIPNSIADVPSSSQRSILRNTDKTYERDTPPAVLNAHDISSPEMASTPGASCQLRLADKTQLALRHALLDPASRIRLDSDDPPPVKAELVGMHWDGGFLHGQTLPMTDGLNVLVGAPGSGKSTVIESLRCAFELEPTSPRAWEDHAAIQKDVLRAGTTISVVVQRLMPTPRRYVVERQLPNPSVVRDSDTWEVSDLRPADLEPLPQIYGQHEIADLAEDATRRTALLDRFVGRNAKRQAELDATAEDLVASREKLDRTVGEVETLTNRLSLLPAARERLRHFEEAKVAERLAEQTLLDRELRVVSEAREHLDGLDEIVDQIEVPERTDLLDAALQKSPFLGQLNKVVKALDIADAGVKRARTGAQERLATSRDQVEDVFAAWKKRRAAADAALLAIKAELEAENIDHEVFRDVQGRVDELEALGPQLLKAERRVETQASERRALLVRRETLEGETLKALQRAASRATSALAPFVRIDVTAGVDHVRVAKLLRSHRGRVGEALKIFQADPTFSPRELAEVARIGGDELVSRWQITENQAATIAGLPRAVLLELEELPLLLGTSIQLNTAKEGDEPRWSPLERLSKGQRAIAVLLLLLLDSEATLVVDQPEDDLDNRFISSRIVPAVRDAKGQRQFLFSTHNANVPVLGDAELVAALTFKEHDSRIGAIIDPEQVGAVDKPGVRALIEQRLEGGRPAFETRRRRYRLE